jgi:hypothetical protein
MKRSARRVGAALAVIGVLLGAPEIAGARTLVFAETWENGTAAWRTALNNGGDCKGFPTCPFQPAMCGPTFPSALMENTIQLRDGDGEGGRDANTCSGKYVNIPRPYAGYDAGNVFVTGGVTQAGITYKNAQFPVVLNDKLCMVAWIRAYNEDNDEAGPYIGINYTGAHGVVDAGHNHCTHFVIGSMTEDPAVYCNWRTGRTGYGAMTQVIKDGAWHRYKASFAVNASDLQDWRLFSPEFPPDTTWVNDKLIYGQPRLSLFGMPPERLDVAPATGAPAIQNGADFGDVYVFKAETAAEDPCPTDAELDSLPFASDHACGPNMLTCKSSVAAVPAGARTPAQPGNNAYRCWGCETSFGAGSGPTSCPEATPLCVGIGATGGTCSACASDEGVGDPATRCAAPNPMCRPGGACGRCAADADCASGGAHGGPSCNPASGACFACTAEFGGAAPTACTQAAPHCNTATGACGKCTSNADCVGSSAGAFCDPGTGACAKCDGDVDVSTTAYGCTDPGAPTCNATTGLCGACASDADCVNPPGLRLHSHVGCDGAGRCSQGGIAPVPPPAGEGPGGRGADGADSASGGCSSADRGGSSLGLLAGAVGVALLGLRRRRHTARRAGAPAGGRRGPPTS